MLSAAERHQKAVVEFDDAKDNELTAEHALSANITEGAQGLVGAQGETVLENWNRATQRVSRVFIKIIVLRSDIIFDNYVSVSY